MVWLIGAAMSISTEEAATSVIIISDSTSQILWAYNGRERDTVDVACDNYTWE